MRTDILEIEHFYASSLGHLTSEFISTRLLQAWGSDKGLRFAGFGYTEPYLELFPNSERAISLMPEGMGTFAAKNEGHVFACLTSDMFWPLPDASMDRIFIIHGLEETAQPRRLLREAWRVLADDGRMIIAVPNRRGPWAMVDSTPFSAGRPFLRGQLDRLLRSTMFMPSAWSTALYFPPTNLDLVLKSARAWERAGEKLWAPFAGVLLVEVAKQIAVPAGGSKVGALTSRVLRPTVRAGAKVATSTDLHHNAASKLKD